MSLMATTIGPGPGPAHDTIGPMTDVDDRTMRERMLAGDPYIADDPDIFRESNWARQMTHRINTLDPADTAQADRLFRELLGAVGEDTHIRPPFHCDYGYQTFIGARTFANFGLMCLDVARITIGDDVQIGPNVQLLTPTHPVEPGPRRDKWESAEPITIGDNVWLGGGVIVCPGVTIGENTVVGAGAVVTRALPPGVLAVGNPARVVRTLG
jgi:maltose O-acetyltransferase